jgi:ATP-dependent protease ClpP protease subunit
MNKRTREILAALQPAADVALQRAKPRTDVPGLAMHARVSAEAPAELTIYGTIGGGGWFNDGISAADVESQLRAAGPGPINVRLNSGGGDVFDGIAIHTLLARHAGTVTVYVDGLAASAASFIMLAGDHIVSARNAMIMIHDGMTMTYGGPASHQRAMDLLTKVSDNIADMYAERAGEDPEFWRAAMSVNGEDGTWYTGQEALDAGLVDELTTVPDDEDVQNVAKALTGWSGIGGRVSAFLAEHPVTDCIYDEQHVPDDDVSRETSADEPEPVTDDGDFAHSMRMWAWSTGRTATKETA